MQALQNIVIFDYKMTSSLQYFFIVSKKDIGSYIAFTALMFDPKITLKQFYNLSNISQALIIYIYEK